MLDPDDKAVIADCKRGGAVLVTWDRILREASGGVTPYELMEAPKERESCVEDIVIARQLYLEIHGRLSRMELAVLWARLRGYRLLDILELLGLEYDQIRNAATWIWKKVRRIWNGNTDQASQPAAPETAQGRFF